MAGFGDYPGKKGGYGHGEALPSLGRGRGGKAGIGGVGRTAVTGSGDLNKVMSAASSRKGHHAKPSRGTSRTK